LAKLTSSAQNDVVTDFGFWPSRRRCRGHVLSGEASVQCAASRR